MRGRCGEREVRGEYYSLILGEAVRTNVCVESVWVRAVRDDVGVLLVISGEKLTLCIRRVLHPPPTSNRFLLRSSLLSLPPSISVSSHGLSVGLRICWSKWLSAMLHVIFRLISFIWCDRSVRPSTLAEIFFFLSSALCVVNVYIYYLSWRPYIA